MKISSGLHERSTHRFISPMTLVANCWIPVINLHILYHHCYIIQWTKTIQYNISLIHVSNKSLALHLHTKVSNATFIITGFGYNLVLNTAQLGFRRRSSLALANVKYKRKHSHFVDVDPTKARNYFPVWYTDQNDDTQNTGLTVSFLQIINEEIIREWYSTFMLASHVERCDQYVFSYFFSFC